jgi:hypothetical protein
MHSDRTVILFGAGASFGSEQPGIRVPPVATQLFGKLVDFSPDVWGALPTPYPALFQEDFEAAFRKLGDDSPNPLSPGFNPMVPCPAQLTGPLLRKMAEYFLDFAPSKESLYVRLLTRVKEKDWRGVLATLNYDLLLPIALEKSGVFACVNPWTRESLRVCFPHGCSAILIKPGQMQGNPVLIGLGNRIDAEVVFERDMAIARQRWCRNLGLALE